MESFSVIPKATLAQTFGKKNKSDALQKQNTVAYGKKTKNTATKKEKIQGIT